MFSNSTKTYVGTSVSRAIPDDLLPNSIKQATIYALHSDRDILESITEHLSGSIGVKAERMYKYGEDRYVFGNPSGEFTSANIAPKVIEEILKREFNDPFITVNYSKFGQMNLYHLAWKNVVENFNYDSRDNSIEINVPTQFPTKLENVVVHVPKPELENGSFSEEALERWERSPQYRDTALGSLGIQGLGSPLFNPVFFWNLQSNISASLIWTLEIPPVAPGAPFENIDDGPLIPDEASRTIAIPLDNYDYEGEYFQAKYTREGREYFWFYKAGSGTYPELDNFFESEEHTKVFGEFYPMGYFQLEKKSLGDDKDSEAYKSSKKLMKYIGLDYDDVLEAVEDNPDIGDIEQAMIYFGLPGVSEHPIENQYLFEFFDKLYYFQDNQYQRPEEATHNILNLWQEAEDINLANAIIIQDRAFKMALQNRGIYKQRRAGTIGEEGDCTSEYKEVPYIVKGFNEETGQTEELFRANFEHIYRKQIGIGIYEELRVINLAMRFYVWGNYSTVGDEEEEILLIPLEKSILEMFTVPQKEELFSRGLHYVFNSRITVTTKWYESGFFQFVIMLASAVMIATAMGPALSLLNAKLALGAITATQLLMQMGTMLLKGVLASIAFKLLVDVVGIEIAIVFAVVLAAYGMYDAFSSGGMESAPWAQDLIKAANGLIKAASESITDALNILQVEATDFLAEAEEQLKLLEEANDLLRPTSVLSPFIYLGESAEAFYNRTIHSGNVGVMSIDAQSMFVEQALRLPTTHDTLGR